MKNRIWSAGFVAAILLTFSSCMFLGIGSSPSDTGTIEIILGASGRSVVQASQSTTASYLLEITGSDGFKDSRTLSKNAGSYSISLQPGEYTLTITAISADGKESAWDQQNVTVSVGRTVPVAFQLKAGGYQDTKIYLWNNSDSQNDLKYILKSFDTLKQIPESLSIEQAGEGSTAVTFAEDKNGNVYFVKENAIYRNGSLIASPNHKAQFEDALFYDCETDSLWSADIVGSNSVRLFEFNNVSSFIGNENELMEGKVHNLEVNSSQSGNIRIMSYAVRNNTIYVGYGEGNDLYVRKFQIIGDVEETVDQLGETYKLTDTGLEGEITDLAVIAGKLYVLVSNYKNFTFSPIPEENKVYSRGCLVELEDEGTSLHVVRSTGWTDTARQLEEKNAPEGLSIDGDSPVKKVELYAPTAKQSASAFYGPRRIVAIKPKELYIVDSGVNITLTDWKGFGNGAKPNMGQIYQHERLMKVDLRSFGLSVLKEEINHGIDSISGYFAKVEISETRVGYRILEQGINSPDGTQYISCIKGKYKKNGDMRSFYYAEEDLAKHDYNTFSQYDYFGPFSTEEE